VPDLGRELTLAECKGLRGALKAIGMPLGINRCDLLEPSRQGGRCWSAAMCVALGHAFRLDSVQLDGTQRAQRAIPLAGSGRTMSCSCAQGSLRTRCLCRRWHSKIAPLSESGRTSGYAPCLACYAQRAHLPTRRPRFATRGLSTGE
jgi:hypothetical protein